MKDFKDLQKVMEGRRSNTLKKKAVFGEDYEEVFEEMFKEEFQEEFKGEGEEAKGQREKEEVFEIKRIPLYF